MSGENLFKLFKNFPGRQHGLEAVIFQPDTFHVFIPDYAKPDTPLVDLNAQRAKWDGSCIERVITYQKGRNNFDDLVF